MHVLDLFNESDRGFLKSLTEKEKESDNNDASSEESGNKDTYLDPELQRTMAYAQSHYPSYKDPQLAFDKWVQRSLANNVEADQEQDDEINRLKRRYEELSSELKQLKSMRAMKQPAANTTDVAETKNKVKTAKLSRPYESVIQSKSTLKTDGTRQVRYQVIDQQGTAHVFETKSQAVKFFKENIETPNPTDHVTMDVPLLLRVLEFSKEDAKTDMDLHTVTTNLIELSKSGKTLTMDDYNAIVGDLVNNVDSTEEINEVGDRYWCSTDKRWKDR